MRRNYLKCLGFVLATVGCLAVNAQNVLRTPNGSTIRVTNMVSLFDIMNDPLERAIIGSPYLNDTFSNGKVFLQSGDQYTVEMRYNIFYDQIEFKERDSVFSVGADPIIRQIVIGPQTLVVDAFIFKNQKLTTYFSLLDSGKLTLLAKMRILFKEAEEKPIQGFVPGRYDRDKDDYYFRIGNDLPVKIRSISKIIDELPDHKQEMEEYSKKEKISSNSAEDLIKFFRYYNGLKRS